MLSFDELFEEVVGRAGGQQATADDVFKVQRSVRIVLERWQAKRYPTWRVDRQRVTAPGYTTYVTLPETVDDVLHIGVLRDDGASSTVTRIHMSRYAQLSVKNTEGSPAQFYLERSDPPKLFLFPVGTPGRLEQLEVWCIRRPATFKAGETEASSVPGRWLEALVTSCAHDLASKRPDAEGNYNEPLIARLKTAATDAEGIALDADRDRSRFRYHVGSRL